MKLLFDANISHRLAEALRSMLDRANRPPAKYRLDWVIVEGGARPGIDLSDRDALMDLMDGQR